MSSQESAAAAAAAAAVLSQPPSQQQQKQRNRATKKRRVRRRAAPAPPGRLGWLGDGMATGMGMGMASSSSSSMPATASGAAGNAADENTNDDNDGGNNDHQRDSQSCGSERLLTPRPDSNSAPIAGGAIDLTSNNDDEFTFQDSPQIARSNTDSKKKKAKSSSAGPNDGNNSSRNDNNNNGSNSNDDQQRQWSCRKCTFLNAQTLSHCAMCGSRRESTRSAKHNHRSGDNSARSRTQSSNENGNDEGTKQQIVSKKKKPENNNHNNGMRRNDDDGKKKQAKSERKSDNKEKKKKNKASNQSLLKWTSSSSSQQQQRSSSQTASFSQHSFRSKSLSTKRCKKLQSSSSSSTTKMQNNANDKPKVDTEMWIDKHAPRSVRELCVAPKKIEAARQFLSSHLDHAHSRRRHHSNKWTSSSGNDGMTQQTTQNPWDLPSDHVAASPETKLMVLVGSPGIGKSTMIKALAGEMSVEVLVWNDLQVDYNMHHPSSSSSNGNRFGDGAAFGGYLPYQSQLNSFEDFLNQGGVGKRSLDLGLTSAGDGDGDIGLSSDYGRRIKRDDREKKEEFVGSLILIEEIPNLYNAEAAQSFRNIMERHIQRTQTPTFFIFSDVHEGKHKPDDLERLIPSKLLYSPLVQILPIQPVTKAKMKKCLQTIAKAEGLSGSGSKSCSTLTPEFFEETHLSSGGDLRHAIFAMQFLCSNSATRERKSSNSNQSSTSRGANKKDAKLSTFHALGKLLYAKRKQQQQPQNSFQQIDSDDDSTTSAAAAVSSALASTKQWNDGRGPLDFIPEEILTNIDMPLSSSITFLSYHSPDFFTDITDLSRSYDLLSDASTFVDRYYGQSSDGPFPMEYAACIGGRAVADGNKHPAPPTFRQFVSPKVFGVMKKNRENEVKIEKLRKRLSISGGGGGLQFNNRISIHDTIGSARQFVTDSLPYMRSVIPEDVNYALANLHSYAKDSTNDGQDASFNEQLVLEEEENKVLLEDDLVEDNDDDGW